MIADPQLLPRFDGAAAWATMTPEQQAEIGAIALEYVIASNGYDASNLADNALLARAHEAAELHLQSRLRAQGFPDRYIIDRGVMQDGREIKLTKTASIRMCGNSVCPPLAEALVQANYVPQSRQIDDARQFTLEAVA